MLNAKKDKRKDRAIHKTADGIVVRNRETKWPNGAVRNWQEKLQSTQSDNVSELGMKTLGTG